MIFVVHGVSVWVGERNYICVCHFGVRVGGVAGVTSVVVVIGCLEVCMWASVCECMSHSMNTQNLQKQQLDADYICFI